jgi:zf-MYND-like zinc finger, mRNA-binding
MNVGSCNGRAFFCGQDCLKEGWRDHKKIHKCRKLD